MARQNCIGETASMVAEPVGSAIHLVQNWVKIFVARQNLNQKTKEHCYMALDNAIPEIVVLISSKNLPIIRTSNNLNAGI